MKYVPHDLKKKNNIFFRSKYLILQELRSIENSRNIDGYKDFFKNQLTDLIIKVGYHPH